MSNVYGLQTRVWCEPSEDGVAYAWSVCWLVTDAAIGTGERIHRAIASGQSPTMADAIKLSVRWQASAFKAGPNAAPILSGGSRSPLILPPPVEHDRPEDDPGSNLPLR